jgi:hypothetical protein
MALPDRVLHCSVEEKEIKVWALTQLKGAHASPAAQSPKRRNFQSTHLSVEPDCNNVVEPVAGNVQHLARPHNDLRCPNGGSRSIKGKFTTPF